MIRAGSMVAALAMAGCSGASSPVPTGFPAGDCQRGPRIGGTAELGAGSEGLITDIDATISMAARTDGGCVGASIEADDR